MMAIVDIEYEKWQKDFEDEFPDLFKGGSLTGPVTALRRDLMRTAYMAGKKASRQPVGQEPVCSGGFVIGNASGEKYRAWGQVGPEWVSDRSAALWLVRRADAEALASEDEDAWHILPVARCALPPNGWACTLASGHEGPCPTIAAPPAQGIDLGQFREPVHYWRRAIAGYVNASGVFGSATRAAYASKVVEADRLLALLDGRDAGTGVE